MSKLVGEAKPTAFHNMLSKLGQEGRLLRLYTQNVDGLDAGLAGLETEIPLNMKGPWPTTVQLHGGLDKMSCSKCSKVVDFDPALFNGPKPPLCKFCADVDRVRTDHAGKRSHGIGRLRPRMVLYNERNPDEDAIGSVVSADLRTRPDAIIVVGTSMKIPGVRRIVREMCGVVRDRRDGLAVWINRDGPPLGKEFEDCWDLVVKGPCDEVANQFTLSLEPKSSHQECTNSDVETAKGRVDVEVRMPSPTKQFTQMLTPAASPAPKPVEVKKLKLKLKPPPEDSKPRNSLSSKSKPSKAGRPAKTDKGPLKPNPKPSGTSKKKTALTTDQKHSYTQLTSSFKITKPTDCISTTAATKSKSKSKSSSPSATTTPRKHQQEPIQLSSPPPTSPRLPPYRLSNSKPSPSKPSAPKWKPTHHHQSPQKLSGSIFPNLSLDLSPSKSLPAMYFAPTLPVEVPSRPSSRRQSLPHRPGLHERHSTSSSASSNDSNSNSNLNSSRSSTRSLLSTRSFKPPSLSMLPLGLDGTADINTDVNGFRYRNTNTVQANKRISSSPPPHSPLTSPVLPPVYDEEEAQLEVKAEAEAETETEEALEKPLLGDKNGKGEGGGRKAEARISDLSDLSALNSLAEESEESFLTAVEGEYQKGGMKREGRREEESRKVGEVISNVNANPNVNMRLMREGTVSPVSIPKGMEILLCT